MMSMNKFTVFFALILSLILVNSVTAIVQWHPAGVIAPGTFGQNLSIGDYTFPQNLYINGSLGIGTSSPSTKLDVNGSISISSNNLIYHQGSLIFKYDPSNYNLGIGDTSGLVGIENVIVGYQAGHGSSEGFQTAVGANAGYSNSGSEQTAVGTDAGFSNTGNSQTAVGSYAGNQNKGMGETAVGANAGSLNKGDYVVAIGYYSAYLNNGYRVIGIGYYAANENNGSDVVAIGYNAGNGNVYDNQFIVQDTHVNPVPLIQGNFSSGNVGIGLVKPQAKLDVNGTASIRGILNVNSNRIENVANPSSNSDALNLGYADNRYVNVAGDTMTGDLNMNSNNVSGVDQLTASKMVDRDDSNYYVNPNGASKIDTLTTVGATSIGGNLNMNSHQINNVANPSSNSDALNLGYADSRYVNVAGDTMTGDLNMNGHKVTNLVMTDSHGTSSEAANKNYVDWASSTTVNSSVSGSTNYVAKFTGSHTIGNSIIYDNGNVGIGTSSPSAKLDVNGTATVHGTLNVNSNRIENVANPSSNSDALNLGYADSRYVNVAGDTMTGDLNMNTHSISGVNQLTASSFVDRDDSNYYVNPNGGSKIDTLTTVGATSIGGNLNMNSHQINNVANPSSNSDALNLGYADSRYVNVAGDTMTGDLNMNTHSISGVNQLTASKIVDRDNSNYYLDPSSTSKVNQMWVTSNLLVQGNISNVNVDNLNTNGSLLPTYDNRFDVGNSSKRWRNGYFSGSLSANTLTTSSSATIGSTLSVGGNVILNSHWLSGDGGNEGVFVDNSGNVGIGTSSPGAKLDVNGAATVHGALNVNSNRIENVANPSSSSDAVNLGYADSRYVNVAGDTMNGDLDMNSHNVAGVDNLSVSNNIKDGSGTNRISFSGTNVVINLG